MPSRIDIDSSTCEDILEFVNAELDLMRPRLLELHGKFVDINADDELIEGLLNIIGDLDFLVAVTTPK